MVWDLFSDMDYEFEDSPSPDGTLWGWSTFNGSHLQLNGSESNILIAALSTPLIADEWENDWPMAGTRFTEAGALLSAVLPGWESGTEWLTDAWEQAYLSGESTVTTYGDANIFVSVTDDPLLSIVMLTIDGS